MWHFAVHLDHETSKKAGAANMFQIMSLVDDEGKDWTDLIDQGMHFSTLEEVKMAILKGIADRITIEEI
jgi:type I restriction enzyme S subunit